MPNFPRDIPLLACLTNAAAVQASQHPNEPLSIERMWVRSYPGNAPTSFLAEPG